MDIFEAVKYGIIAASIYAAGWQIAEIIQIRHRAIAKTWPLEKVILAVCFIYWAVYYIRSALGLVIGSTHQIYVRMPLMLMIVAFGASISINVIRHRRKRK